MARTAVKRDTVSVGEAVAQAPGVTLSDLRQVVPGPGMPLVPGIVPGGPAPELPYPQPTDLIPRPGVPVPPAIPVPAPDSGAARNATAFAMSSGTPVLPTIASVPIFDRISLYSLSVRPSFTGSSNPP